MEERTKDILKSQKKMYLALVATVILVIIAVTYFVFDEGEQDPIASRHVAELPGDGIDTKEVLLSRVETQNQNLGSKLNYLENLILEGKKQEASRLKENLDLKNQISQLRSQVREIGEREQQASRSRILSSSDDELFCSPEDSVATSRPPLNELVAEGKDFKLKNVENVIPAGTTVKAILVSSVDANCSTYSTTDPQPVKLRILDVGHLPKGVQVDLKGGIIIASAYGDISSERAYIRLERFTKVNPSGDFIETEVTGFVSGEDGKYGVRGIVVDRSEKQVKNAALSGFFSGVSELAQAAIDAKYSRGYGCCDHHHDQKSFDPNLLGEAALSGTSSAFDRLSEYYIKRSEQIRPVIQVSAGRIVDITFTHAAELGDLNTKRKLEAIRTKNRGDKLCVR